jgi:transcriptional regulator with XRE-family HTH domain
MMTDTVHTWASYRVNSGYTQQGIADKIGVSRHMIMRLEQGLFAEPPRRFLDLLGFYYDVPTSDLIKSYHALVKHKRETYSVEYRSFSDVLKGYIGFTNPLVYYREVQNLSRIGFCKRMCLHPDPIRDYEINMQRGIPLQLINACNSIQWDYAPLESAVTEWRISGRYRRV